MSAPLLILRPEPGASRTAAAARAMGLAPILYPLFDVVSRAWDAPGPAGFDAILFTSANALRHGGAALAAYRGLPAFAVGRATAEAARAAGFAAVHAGAADAQQLARDVAEHGHVHVLHLSGEDVRPFDPGPLRVVRRIVYAAREAGDAAGLGALIVPGMVALLHSPRAARRFAALLPAPRRVAVHLRAISPATLAAAGNGWASGRAAGAPNDKALLALAAILCK